MLYEIAEEHGITVDSVRLNGVPALSYKDGAGDCYVALDPMQMDTHADECVRLAHEVGHCVKGAFYIQYSPVDDRRKCEYQADKWAVTVILPPELLAEAFSDGRTELWEAAEWLGLPDEFVEKAMRMYARMGKLVQRSGGCNM